MNFLLLLASLQFVFAQPQSKLVTDQLRSSKALKFEFVNKNFQSTLTSGFHFNEKAPNRIQIDQESLKPQKISATKIEFENLKSDWKTAVASLYVCDDAVTYCETHRVELSQAGATAAKKSVSQVEVIKHKKPKINSHGFIEQNLAYAIAQSQKSKKLILVDFGARWCPGCVRLETEIFDQKFFKKESKDFIKIKIDTDLFENVVLTEKFKIYGIPTLMLMNSDQKEIGRLVDYQPENVIQDFFKEAKAYPTPMEDLKLVAKKDSAVKLILGRRLLLSTSYKEAYEVLKTLQPAPLELNHAEVEMNREIFKKDPTQKAQFEKVLQKVIAQEPRSSRSINWRQNLVELLADAKQKEKLVDEGVKLADELLANPEELKKAVQGDLVGEFTNYEAFWVAIQKADLVETGRGEAEGIKAWAQAANVAQQSGIQTNQKGPALRYLLILQAAQEFEKADQWSASLLKLDSKNWDVARRRLKVLLELKKYKEAILLGEKVIQNSYDRNQFWVAEVLSKAYILSGNKEKALGLINDYLRRPEASWDHMKSSRTKLEEMKKSLL